MDNGRLADSPGWKRPICLSREVRGQFVEQTGDPVALDVSKGDAVDAGGAAVAAHLLPRPLQDVPAVDLVVERVEPSSGIGLGRPVERALQFLDLVIGGPSHSGTHRPFPGLHT